MDYPLIFSATKGDTNTGRLGIALWIALTTAAPTSEWELRDTKTQDLLADNNGSKVDWIVFEATDTPDFYVLLISGSENGVNDFTVKGEAWYFSIKDNDLETGLVTVKQFSSTAQNRFGVGKQGLIVPNVLPAYVSSLEQMFSGALTFNQDISSWDVSNIKSTKSTFKGAVLFNRNIGAWNVKNIRIMGSMFYGALAFNQDISSWDVSGVSLGWEDTDTMVSPTEGFESMLRDAASFNQDLSRWCVSRIPTLPYRFTAGTTTTWTLPKPVWGTCPRGEDSLPS